MDFFIYLRVSCSFCYSSSALYAFLLFRTLHINSRKVESKISSKDEQSQQLASKIQEMQSHMQKAAVEAAKAVAQQAS